MALERVEDEAVELGASRMEVLGPVTERRFLRTCCSSSKDRDASSGAASRPARPPWNGATAACSRASIATR
jgi:hypothetical protein